MKKRSALALSGGGYRATLFAVGSLYRLNELGILKNLNRITAVSGGSIALGYLALHWNDLKFSHNDVAENFETVIAEPLQEFCSHNLDVAAAIGGILSFSKTTGDKIIKAYNKRLFHNVLLRDIPKGDGIPEFLFYATNLGTGSSVRITNETIFDYKLGEAPVYNISLAQAVAASSAFPPVLSPVIFDSKKWAWKKKNDFNYLYDNQALRDRLVLTDGGLYDNMGIEAIWKEEGVDHFDNVLVCDAGAPFKFGFDMKKENIFSAIGQKIGFKRNWFSQLSRMSDIMIDQQRALRKKQLIKNYSSLYSGAYWATSTKIEEYSAKDKIASDSILSKSIAQIPTRLNAFREQDRAHLINWGYALADAAVRTHLYPQYEAPEALPIPAYPL